MAPPSTPPKGQSIRSSQKNSSITPKTSPSLSPSNSISAAWSADELSADTIRPNRQQQQQNRMSSSPLKFDSNTSPRWQQQSKPNSPKRTTTEQQQRLTQSTDEKQRKQHQMSFLLPSSADGQSSESSSGRARKTQRSSSTAGIFDIDTDDAASDADTTIAQASGHSTNTASLLARYEGLNRSGSLSKLPQKQLRQGKGSNSTSTSAFIGGSSGRHLSSGSGGDGNSSSGSSSSSIVDGGSGGSSTTLSVPLPVPHHSTTLPSPTTRHARGLFDATPSFSSPLAYAPLLPSEMADDLDLDSPVPRQNEGESSSLGSSSTHKTLSSPEQSKQTLENKTERSMSQSIDNAFTSKKSPKLDSETNSPSFSPQLSSRKSGHSASSSISTTMGPPLTIPRKSSGQSSGHASAIGSSSIRLPEGGEGGPKQVRALLQRGKGGSGNMSGSGPGSRRVSEATSDDGSYRSASGSSTGSAAYSQSGTSTNNSLNNSWAAMNALTPTQNTTAPSSSHQNTTVATPQQQNRARSNTQSSVSSIHRRARSLGGSLLGELASSIGGPDGVDPDLVAAIRAGDAEIPGGSNNNVLSDSATIRQLHDQLAAASSSNNLTPSTSASNNLSSSMTFSNAAEMAGHNASVPSTPSGSLRIVSRRGELLTVNPETRTLGTSYPSFAVQNEEEYGDEDSNHTGKRRKSSMSSNVIPQDYVRSRVRSQTTAGQPFTSSEQFSPRSIDHQFLNARQSIQSYDHPSLGLRSQSRNREIGGHGLGIGMEGNTNESNLQIPHDQQGGGGMVEGSNRSASPLMYHDSAILSSASTSGRTSPVVWRHQQGDGMSDSLFAPREIHNNNSSQQNLSVKIPTFDRQQAGMGPISALPALNYSPQSSPVMRTNLLPLSKSPGDITGRSISSEVSPEMRTRPIPDLEGTQSVPVQNRQEDGTRGRTSLSHAVSIRGRGKRDNAGTRRFSTVQAPHGIDEYAQIIIQSRNAKMQKWKASSSNATGNQRGLGPAFGNESTADQSENSVNKEADGSRTIIAATPNVSPANSLSGEGEEAISSPNDDSGKREIEWVDWLDEYRKLKEAKLRAEKEEGSAVDIGKGEEKQPQKEEKEKTSKDSTVESNKSSPISAQNSPSSSSPHQSQTLQTPSKETRRKNSQSQMHISKSVTSNLDYGQGRSLPRRRPSDLPIRSNQFADGNRSWSASLSPNTAFLPSSAGSRSGHNDDDRSLAAPTNYASLGRRSSIMGLGGSNGEKSRTLSLSPITSRIGSSGSYQSGNVGNSGNASSGRRKKLLGSKIEAWWGAVKSGFGGVSTLPPASAPAHSRHSIRNSIAMPTDASDITSGMSKLGINDNSAFRGGSDLQQVRSMFGDHGGFSQGHLRSQTHRQPSEAKSVHTLKPSLSAQDLKRRLQSDPNTGVEGGGSTDASSSVDQQFQKSDRSSVDTAHQATAPPSSSRTERSRDRKSDAASEQECSETMSNDGSSSVTGTNNNNNSASKPRKGPKLSLHLEHGLSTFDAGPFEHMTPGSQSVGGVDTSGATDNKITGLQPSNLKTASSKSSPSSKDPPVSLSPKSSGLSDAWKPSGGRSPHSPHSGKAASPASGNGGQAQPSPNSRGGSKLRDSVSAIGVETERKRSSQGKDITIDSIRTHIHHRLTLSKENCDRELRKIILAINAYVEEGIQDQQIRFLQQQEDEQDEIESTRRALENIEIETQNDLAGMAYDSNKDKDDNLPSPLEGKGEGLSKEDENMESGMGAAPAESSLISSNANDAAADDLLGAPRSRQTSVNVIGKGEYSLPPPPQRTPSSMMRSMSRGNIRNRSRELTSTSTSRSHSPLPGSGAIGGQGSIYGADSPQYSPARRIRPLPLDDIPLQPFIGPLQDLVGIAMDVLDTTINNLTSRTGACREIISNVQEIGHAWEEHPDWPGRGWYVQLLLAVAGLSRVVEWWEAERGFWNFADDVDEFDQEPIRFIVGGQSSNQNNQSSAGPISSITDGTSTTEYNDPLPSTNTTSTARSLISSSPMRMIRSAALTQASANRTPSQQSSATNSPALEPADRRTFGESTDALRSTHSSTPILPAPLDDDDDEPQNLDGVEQQEDAAADTTTTVAALPSSVKDSQNILMELSLDGERFLYLSPAWQTVLGSDPGELFDQPIEEVLAPGDAQTFAEATQQLQSDDSHTVEAAFRLLVHPSIIPDSDGNTRYYQEMEGKGMLMQDRQNGSPSHTMWVFKPTGPPEPEDDLAPGPQKPSTAGVGDLSMAGGTSVIDAGQQNPFLSTEPLLCRICERDVPTWFFEKHSEICNEIHRLEMEISESNEILAELRRTSRTIVTQIESNEEPIEYRNVLLTTPAASTLPPSALEVANRSLSPRHPNPAAIRKAHLRALTGLIDILRVAGAISTPATKDDADPIEKERLLSPESESKIVQVRNWKMIPLPAEDAAIELLAADVDAAMRRKLSAVNRMLNTIVYVETVRMEWEQRVEEALAEMQGTTLDLDVTEDDVGEDETQDHFSPRQQDEDREMEEEDEEQHRSSSTIAHSEVDNKPANAITKLMASNQLSNDPSTIDSLPPSRAQPVPSKLAQSSNQIEEDDIDGDSSAVLLEQYDNESAVPGSTTLSAKGDDLGGEDEIPAVETAMGGSVLRPIPIPTRTNIAPRIRQMQRDTSAVSSSSGGDGGSSLAQSSTGTGGGTTGEGSKTIIDQTSPSAPLVPHSRRQSIMSGERAYLQTPPLSPRHSPKELTIPLRSVKDRRVSQSMRSMGGQSPYLGGVSAGGLPHSPRIPPMAPSSRPTASSIKDFDIIKPISKGAFGSVFLTRKRTTGDYYAIKVLKKSDMIAKNQITNVKAERMILMTQTQSPFVVKLFFTFQSSENLYLVMEYLPGGDLANLVKNLGSLSEEWTKQFVAEVVNGLEMLHGQGVVHRDMKPDNLLIDQKGHLKLTDFGLSKIGLLGRQNRQQMQQTPLQPASASMTTTNSGGRGSQSAGSGTGSTPPSSWQHMKKDSISSTTTSGSLSYSPLSSRLPSSARAASIPDTPSLIGSQPFYVGTPTHPRGRIMSASTDASDSSGSEGALAFSNPNGTNSTSNTLRNLQSTSLLDSPKNAFGSIVGNTQGSGSGSGGAMIGSIGGQAGSGSSSQLKKFVGTPDYLAPESILGLGMDDAAVDWWALGVILYELLYGYPPFHAETPEKVFDNILSRNISWEDEDIEVSAEARDLMEKLMCTDRKNRLGTNGTKEIKSHPFFTGIDWDNLTEEEGPFVPQINDPESTDYFDLRGAVFMDLQNEDGNQSANGKDGLQAHSSNNMGMHEFAKAIEGHARFSEPSRPPTRGRTRSGKHPKDSSQGQTDEFGSFSYKNLPVLKQANDEVIKKMRGDQLNSMSAAMEQQQQANATGANLIHARHRSISGKVVTPSSHRGSAVWMPVGPPSPTTSVSSQSSVPSKSTAPTSPSGAPFMLGNVGGGNAAYLMHNLVGGGNGSGSASASLYNPHRRRPSEMSSNTGLAGSPIGSMSGSSTTGPLATMMERKRSQFAANNQAEEDIRRTSLPTRLRTASVSTNSGGGNGIGSRQQQQHQFGHNERPVLPWQLQVPSNVLPDITAEESYKASPLTGITNSEGNITTDSSTNSGGLGLSGTSNQPASSSPLTVAGSSAPLTGISSTSGIGIKEKESSVDQINCMIAEDNPISSKMLEGILTKLGCKSMSVRNGAEALRLAMGETKFSVLFIDVTLPIVSGQDVAKMIKSTRNINSITPIIALASFDKSGSLVTNPNSSSTMMTSSGTNSAAHALDILLESTGGVFDAVLAKPVDKQDICSVLPKFGFQLLTTTKYGGGSSGGGGVNSNVSGLNLPTPSTAQSEGITTNVSRRATIAHQGEQQNIGNRQITSAT